MNKTNGQNADRLVAELSDVVGDGAVLSAPDELLVYECDGLPQHKYRPRAVVFPASTDETSAVMKILARAQVPFTPRGAGTGLSGGALSLDHGVVIEMARMRKILNIDEANRIAVVQPGVVNAHVSRAVARLGLHYVPDPSSQPTCTIGGNIAENAGGIHCLKYGTTTDHVLGVRVVLAGGEVVDLGGHGAEAAGYDLLGVFIGSEGTFGIATEATLRLIPLPPAVRTMLAEFPNVDDASHAVSAIIAAGVMPAALEMMDHEIIRAVEASVFAAGLPLDAGAALLIELDGIEAGIDEEAERVKGICLNYGARACRLARDEAERKKLWAARKGAFGAIGRISPDSMIQDAVVPRSKLPEVLADAYRIANKYQLRIANVFHAGDGNLHPLICFDSRFADEVRRVKEAGRELMETCVRAGGSITGEHGVGYDKRELLSLIFSAADMETMLRVRAAFDPTGLCNPGKIIPMLRGCGEARVAQATSNVQSPASNVPAEPGAVATGLGIQVDVQSSKAKVSSESRAVAVRSFDCTTVHHQLAQLLGKENVATSPHLSLSASALTVFPGSIAEVCEIIKVAASERWKVLPAGALTWLDAGVPRPGVNLILSTQRLNRIIEHEPADLVAVTEAGVTLGDFNRTLAQNRQWLPLDPPACGEATIGGVVATGLGGAQQFGYGPPRRHVIGMKVVLADGALIKVGGRVVKNVAGYDLCKLFTGSYGSLGVIVEVNFKLRPLPFETGTMFVSGRLQHLLQYAQQVIAAPLFPVAAELLSPGLACAVDATDWKKQHLLLLRFAGSPSSIRQQTDSARALVADKDGSGQLAVRADDDELWHSLTGLVNRFQDALVWRVGVRPGDLTQFISDLLETRVEGGPSELMWQAGVGDGRIRVFEQLGPKENGSGDDGQEHVQRLQKLEGLAQNFGAALIVEHAPATSKNRLAARTTSDAAQAIEQRVKQQLDPNEMFPSPFWLQSRALQQTEVR